MYVRTSRSLSLYFFVIVISLCTFSHKQAMNPDLNLANPYVDAFSKGIAVKEITNWLYNNINKDDLPLAKTKQNEQILKNSIDVIVRIAADQAFSDSVLGNTLSLTDPRRYLLLGLFQSGQYAIFAFDFVKNWIKEYTKSPKLMIESPQEAPFFRQEAISKWQGLSSWEHIKRILYYPINQVYKYRDVAVASLLNTLVSQVAYMLFTRSQQNQLSTTQNIIGRFITQELGVFASAYLADWVRSLIDDLLVIEGSPYFKGQRLTQIAQQQTI